MSIITLSTVGFGETHPLSEAGKVFVIFYIIGGLSIFLYCATQLGELVFTGDLQGFYKRRRMNNMLSVLKDHHIVCGCGRMGINLCRQLEVKKLPFVVIEKDSSVIEEIKTRGWPFVEGDAQEDDILQQAGIASAKCLATTTGEDATNTFVVLSARMLNSNLSIIARASDDSASTKMTKAGANRVVSPFQAGALTMAQLMDTQNIENFMELFVDNNEHVDLSIIKISSTSPYCHKFISQLNFENQGVTIAAIRRDGLLNLRPNGQVSILPGDHLVCIGPAFVLNAIANS